MTYNLAFFITNSVLAIWIMLWGILPIIFSYSFFNRPPHIIIVILIQGIMALLAILASPFVLGLVSSLIG